MNEAFETLMILAVIATAWTCQWIAYCIGVKHGKKQAKAIKLAQD